jgi:hypothetical protein
MHSILPTPHGLLRGGPVFNSHFSVLNSQFSILNSQFSILTRKSRSMTLQFHHTPHTVVTHEIHAHYISSHKQQQQKQALECTQPRYPLIARDGASLNLIVFFVFWCVKELGPQSIRILLLSISLSVCTSANSPSTPATSEGQASQSDRQVQSLSLPSVAKLVARQDRTAIAHTPSRP